MLPLEGVRVLDLSRLLPGPYCSMLLADYGAEVIKVEDPGLEDYLRAIPPMVEGESVYFRGINRNKRSMTLNLKDLEGVKIFRRLAEKADVVLESFRPGVAERLGIGYEALKAQNPRLVFCSLSGYGQTGPLRDRSGHDLNYVALAGQLDQPMPPQDLRVDGPPPPGPSMPRLQAADMAGAMHAAFSIVSALLGRERTGEGTYLDVAMLDAALSLQPLQVAEVLATGNRSPVSVLSGGSYRYKLYWTKDHKAVALGALEDKFWEPFYEAFHKEFGEAERQHVFEFEPPYLPGSDLAVLFRQRTRDEWVQWANDKDICLEPVLSLPEALEHPQVVARGLVAGDSLRSPVPIPGEDVGPRTPAPKLGEHTETILTELGLSAAEIRSLRERGVC